MVYGDVYSSLAGGAHAGLKHLLGALELMLIIWHGLGKLASRALSARTQDNQGNFVHDNKYSHHPAESKCIACADVGCCIYQSS